MKKEVKGNIVILGLSSSAEQLQTQPIYNLESHLMIEDCNTNKEEIFYAQNTYS